MPFLRPLATILSLGLIALVVWALAGSRFPRAGNFDLAQPGIGTRARLLALDPRGCEALIGRAGIAFRVVERPARARQCAVEDGVAWRTGGARATLYTPAAPLLACPLAASLAAWEWNVVQPAAYALFGSAVVRIDHYGSFACRRVYGRAQGDWSEHARARAIDIAGFRLADGRRVTIASDWNDDGPKSAFLHRVRDGGCHLFGTTLSPDYNAAHRDHLHLDMAARIGGVCR